MRSGLSTAFSLLLLVTCIDATPYEFNFLDNYRRPAPSPEDGPPLSAHASRNRALLPAQICGVVGAYLLTVLIWGTLLLTVGRRMRRKAETAPRALELQLVTARPSGRTPASPASARSATSWFKRGFKTKSNIDSAIGSPESPVVQSPTSFDQKVIESDRDRAQAEMERLYAAVMEHDRQKSYSQVSSDEAEVPDRRPPRIDTTRASMNHSNPASPVRAIYPPGYYSGAPSAPLPRDRERLRDQPPASPRSILSKKSTTSNASTSTNKARFKIKNLRISSPMHNNNNNHNKYPDQGPDDEARTPLSPHFDYPGARTPSQQNSPSTPGDLEAYEQLDEVQPLPRPAPQRLNSSSDDPSSKLPSRSATATSNTLPLRGYAEPLKSPDLRTTVLDRRMDNLSLTSPKTGVPFTPYSPYMPFTPVTPVTPHLVTRKERKSKQSRRMIGREKEEMVQSPKEIFGDAW